MTGVEHRRRRARAIALPVRAWSPLRHAVVALVLALLLLAAVPLLAPGAASADAETIVLAVEEVSEEVGPEVRTAGDPDNAFDPDAIPANYLWGANWGLLFLLAVPFAGMGLLYWLKVGRFERSERS